MEFTQIPGNYAPLGRPVRYAFSHPQAGTFDFRIIDAATDDVLGTKHFAATAAGSFDIAPYLRRAIRYTPKTGATGFTDPSKRSVSVTVETTTAAAPLRTCLHRLDPAEPGILTTLPLTRLIAIGECDEITVLTTQGFTADILVRNSDGSFEGESFRSSQWGLIPFRLNTADYPGAESITVSFGALGQVEYLVVPRPEQACRLAWASTAGSVEHYTFPVQRSAEVQCAKSHVRTPEGYAAVQAQVEHRITLLSAYETPQVLGALAELLASPAVWIAGESGYTPVDVLTTEACTQRPEAMQCLEITLRSTPKTTIR